MADIIIDKKKSPGKLADNEVKHIIEYDTLRTVREQQEHGKTGKLIYVDVKDPEPLNTIDTYIIDGERYKYKGIPLDDGDFKYELVKESELYTVDPKEQIKKETQLDEDLAKFSVNTKALIDSINIPLSSFEVLLPLILDNFKVFNDNHSINEWLKDRGFLDENLNVIKREVTLNDATAFAGKLISLMNASGADNVLNFKEIIPNYASKLELSSNIGESRSISLEDIINKLRLKDKVYSASKDVAIKNFSVTYKSASPRADAFINKLVKNNSDAYTKNNISLVLEHIKTVANQVYLSDNSKQINKDLSNVNKFILDKIEPLYKAILNLNGLVREIDESIKTKDSGVDIADTPSVLDISPKGWNRFILRNHEIDPLFREDLDAWEDLKSITFTQESQAFNAVDTRLISIKDNDLFKFKSLAYNLNRESVINNLIKHFKIEFLKIFLKDINLMEYKEDKKKLKAYLNKMKFLYSEIIAQSNISEVSSIPENIAANIALLEGKQKEKASDKYIKSYSKDVVEFLKKFLNFIEDNNLSFSIASVDAFVDTLRSDEKLRNIAISDLASDYTKLLNDLLFDDIVPKIDNIISKYKISESHRILTQAQAMSNDLLRYLMSKYMEIFTNLPKESYTLGEDDLSQDQSKQEERFYSESSLLSKFKSFFKTAALGTFSLDNLESILKEITIPYKSSKNIRDDSYTESTSDMSRMAYMTNDLINFLNLNRLDEPTLEDITKEINSFISSYNTYVNVIPASINIDFLKSHLSVITTMIHRNLMNKTLAFTEESILKGILNQNDNVNEVLEKFDITDINQTFLKVLKYFNISKYDASAYRNLYQKASTSDPEFQKIKGNVDVSTVYMTIYIANKLFEKYYNLIVKTSGKASVELQNYITMLRFKLITKIADTLESGTSTAIFGQYNQNISNNLNSVDVVYENLKRQYLYKYLPDNMVKSIANFKVLRSLQAQLYNFIKNDVYLSDSIKGSNIEFTDDMLVPYLQQTGLYDLQFNVTKNKDDITILKDVNVLKPNTNRYMYVNFNDNPFRSLFNIVNNAVNRFSISRNAILMQNLLMSAGYTQSRIERFNSIMRDRLDAFIAGFHKISEKSEVIKLKEEYKTAFDTTLQLFKDLDTLAQSTVDNIPDIAQIITDMKSKDPIISQYVTLIPKDKTDTQTKSNKDETNIDNILPIRFELKYNAIDNFNKGNQASNQKYLGEVNKLIEYSKELKSALNTLNFKRQKLTKENIDDEILMKQELNKAQSQKEMSQEAIEEFSKRKDIASALAKVEAIDGIIVNTKDLINDIDTKLSEAYENSNILSDNIVRKHVEDAKQSLYVKLIPMVQNSNKCFEITNSLSKQLLKLDNLFTKIDTKTI